MTTKGLIRRAGLPLLAALVAMVLHAGILGHEFVYDDIQIVRDNPLVQSPPDLPSIFTSHYWKGFRETGTLYRPVTILSFSWVVQLTGEGPQGQHALNLILHGLISAMVVLLAQELGLGRGWALATGLLFAVHPVHVEAVAPVVGRSELLAALFGLAAWLCCLKARRDDQPEGGGRLHPILLVLAPVLFAAALLSKEGIAVLPALVLAGELIRGRGPWRGRLLPVALLGLVLIAWLALRHAVLTEMPAGGVGLALGGVDAWTRTLSAVGILGRYLGLMIWPATLSADYTFNQIPLITSAMDSRLLFSLGGCLALAVAGVWLGLRRRVSGLGLLIYLGALLPVSNLLVSIGTPMGERLLYLPSLGLCLALPALMQELPGATSRSAAGVRWRRRLAALLAVACLLLAGRSLARIPDWSDPLTLFRATVESSPSAGRAWLNLGIAEESGGDRQAALEAYGRAVEIRSDEPQGRRYLGRALLNEGDPGGALVHLQAAASMDPELPEIHLNVGRALHGLGRMGAAAEAFEEEAGRNPGSWAAWFNLGQVRVELGQVAEGLAGIERAESLESREAVIPLQRGHVLALLGRHDEALDAFQKALATDGSILPRAAVPAGRSALAAGRVPEARQWAARAREIGLALPPELAALTP